MNLLDSAHTIRDAALASVDPTKAVIDYLQNHPATLPASFDLVSIGKASIPMAQALLNMTLSIHQGVVVVKEGQQISNLFPNNITVIESSHPIPTEASIKAGRKIMEFLEQSSSDNIVFLISGGSSALMTYPYEGISLEEIQKLTTLLLGCGAPIQEINTVRKHIDQVKGGGLLRSLGNKKKIVTLVLSDVIGDDLSVIASGPTYWDNSTYQEVKNIFEKYQILDDIPQSILQHIESGIEGKIAETYSDHHPIFRKASHHIVGSLSTAIDAAITKARTLGFNAHILNYTQEGEAKEVGMKFREQVEQRMQTAKDQLPLCLLFGGETTLTLNPDKNGKGGRNQELILATGITTIPGYDILYYSFGTDGIDGPTNAAGAYINNRIRETARIKKLDPLRYIAEHNSYAFFKKTNSLIITGQTGTNVGDVTFALINPV